MPDDWQDFAPKWSGPTPGHACRATGCVVCRDTGYLGRAGVYEIMQMNDALRALISPRTDLNAVRRAACAEGMLPLRLAAANKVAAGMTTLEEALRVTPAY